MELDFRHQLMLTVVDKALIGGLIAFVGLWFNRSLEILKSRKELENELQKVRDQKRLEILDTQLSKFYWPIYLRLQMDNVIWERILDREAEDPVKQSLGKEIEATVIIPNHELTSDLIQSNIHLAASNKELFDALVRYVRHVAIYKALRSSGNKDIDPLDVGEPWPDDVFRKVKHATLEKQKEFDRMLAESSFAAD